MSNRNFAFVVLGLLLFLAVGIAGLSRGWFFNDVVTKKSPDLGSAEAGSSEDDSVARDSRKLSEALGLDESDMAQVGGIQRPKRDIRKVSERSSATPPSPTRSAGRLPRLKGDENAQVASLYKELSNKDVPKEALSATFAGEDFDREKYFRDPDKYLNQIRPGRVFRPAQSGPGVSRIAPASERFVTLLQGERVNLKVRAAPNHPVNFYTVDSGEFDNRLKSIAVAANEDGIAEVSYSAVAGTSGLIDVLASSPLHSGQVSFAVNVVLPE